MTPSSRNDPGGRVAVVGAGISGLTCAALLAARGVPVTVFEATGAPGGVARATDALGPSFSPGPQYAWGWDPSGPAWDVLDELEIELVMRRMPDDFEWVALADAPFAPVRDTCSGAIDDLPPNQRDAARRLVDALDEAGAVADVLGPGAVFRLGKRSMLSAILSSSATMSQKRWALAIRDMSVAELARRLGAGERALRRVTHPQAIFAESLSDLSALLYACARRHLCEGVHVPLGGFGRLVDALVDAAERAGAELVFDARVERATLDGHATTLETARGTETFAHVVWACSPGVLAAIARDSGDPRLRTTHTTLERGFEASHPIQSINARIALDARDAALLRDRNFTWFANDEDVLFAPGSPVDHARTINFCSPTLNAAIDTSEHVLCAFSTASERELDALLGRCLARLGVRAKHATVEHMTPEVWTSEYGGFEGSVYGRRLTARSLQRSLVQKLPRAWTLCHSGAGISGILGCLQIGRASADSIASVRARRIA